MLCLPVHAHCLDFDILGLRSQHRQTVYSTSRHYLAVRSIYLWNDFAFVTSWWGYERLTELQICAESPLYVPVAHNSLFDEFSAIILRDVCRSRQHRDHPNLSDAHRHRLQFHCVGYHRRVRRLCVLVPAVRVNEEAHWGGGHRGSSDCAAHLKQEMQRRRAVDGRGWLGLV